MRKCNNCGALLEDNALFCTSCGTKLEVGRHCSNCGAPMDEDSVFCTSCGFRQDINQAPTETSNIPQQEPSTVIQPQPDSTLQEIISDRNTDNSNQYTLIACIVLAVLLCVGGWFAYQKFHDSDDNNAVEQAVPSQSFSFTGSVDKYPVTMYLTVRGSEVKGNYYYDKQGPYKRLRLEGVNNNNDLYIDEYDEYGVKCGFFRGHLSDGVFQGEFTNANGKSMNFRVTTE